MGNEWEILLKQFEDNGDVNSAINLIYSISNNTVETIDLYLRTMFMVLDFLVEGSYSDVEHIYLSKKLKLLFDESYRDFSESAEYLAFTGMMITRAEWYFGKSFDEGIGMIKKATCIEPNCVCYESLYLVFGDQRIKVDIGKKLKVLGQFFHGESNKQSLEGKGLLGRYILGIFENVYKEILQKS